MSRAQVLFGEGNDELVAVGLEADDVDREDVGEARPEVVLGLDVVGNEEPKRSVRLKLLPFCVVEAGVAARLIFRFASAECVAVAHSGEFIGVVLRSGALDEDRERDAGLHLLEHLFVNAVGEPLALVAVKVEDVYLVEGPQQEIPHGAVELALQVGAVCDEGQDPVARRALLLEQLPDRPADEAQVVVAQRAGVRIGQALAADLVEVLEQGVRVVNLVVGGSFVRRVTEDHEHGHLFLDLVRRPRFLDDSAHHRQERELPAFGDFVRFERVRQIDGNALGALELMAAGLVEGGELQVGNCVGSWQELEAVEVL